MITSLLVANRGEIACRVIRTAKAMGLTTVAVHSAVDHDARHVHTADRRVDLGGAKPADSYLAIDKLIDAALTSGAQAVHPGYGFLSENADFARAVEAAGLIFIGPPAAAIEAMGSKSAAKALMEQAGVPLVPGYHGADQSPESFRVAAQGIGYPVLLKASAGGGGKGMKVVQHEAELTDALLSARREAQAAFGDDRLLLEKYLLKPRHVEIQIFADQHGNCLYLHERDCSIQRRHQKVVEEAPAPGLTDQTRRAMGEAAVRAAQAIGYVGAGTVEFLLDERGEFFFMEMNTRLQVEHPVTEAITGLDLVAWQIRVAGGEPLPISQSQVPLLGHAIEVRLYAEDPDQDFLPASGRLELYREPALTAGQRIDSGVNEGDLISPFYDPMLGKLVAWGENREQARLRLLDLLRKTFVGGVRTNRAFLCRILEHPAFAAAELDTDFIPRHAAHLLRPSSPLPDTFWQQAAIAFLHGEPTERRADDPDSPWADRSGQRFGLPASYRLHLHCNGEQRVVRLDPGLTVADNRAAIRNGATLYLSWDDELLEVTRFDPIAAADTRPQPEGGLIAPMNGSIVQVLVKPGQAVAAGTPLIVLEAMKMEHSIRARQSGVVKQLCCSEGDMVSEGAVLVEMEPHSSLAGEASERGSVQ
ncbi:acetyl-CoA carboxylase biotin carboxylase subunit [Halopseudomonas bauzanensis]|uniref:Biotin carboxylase n=1 Tax=Halopseudomonas bauzanensis TaxID=653930 RepID=A0A1I4PGA6_9GAMM|nr:acetyl/propionyl/methylcrotonyl-CoA carboxylase subunit alpha [Halopseudomonas bauzanensis]SES24118.1 3-methylcrotonyl-CoA carboxylase alpha subunit [Halopseudomonas bauzanensis]SFM26566.1 3-methylcrotonyl-CoA carboxylase alpha subunit [Halopseudomonas bauzanensis]